MIGALTFKLRPDEAVALQVPGIDAPVLVQVVNVRGCKAIVRIEGDRSVAMGRLNEFGRFAPASKRLREGVT